MSRWLKSDRTAVAVSVAALAVGGAWRLSLPNPVDATAYHARVRAAAAALPLSFGDWSGADQPLPSEAIDELRPNVAVSRRYLNRKTNRSVDLLLIQCPDVRDIAPHYPPVCYPGQGLTLAGQQSVGLAVGGQAVTATRYAFQWNDFRHPDPVTVDNFMVLPDGNTRPDMTGMERRIGASQRYFGAAQVQVVYGTSIGPAEQTAITEQILRPYGPLLDVIRTGAAHHGRQ